MGLIIPNPVCPAALGPRNRLGERREERVVGGLPKTAEQGLSAAAHPRWHRAELSRA